MSETPFSPDEAPDTVGPGAGSTPDNPERGSGTAPGAPDTGGGAEVSATGSPLGFTATIGDAAPGTTSDPEEAKDLAAGPGQGPPDND